MSVAPVLAVLSLLALWPAIMLSGWAQPTMPVLLPAALAAAAAAGWLSYHAVRRAHWALLLLVMVVVIALSINFRVREYGATGLDWQNGSKLATWLLLVAISAPNWRSISPLCRDPVIALMGTFVIIGCLSASYSHVPAYSAACALSLACYLGFACLLAEEFDQRQLLRWVIGALTVYLVLNWVFTALSPGAGILETDGEGPRLQGLSGHPNSLGRQANVYLALAIGAYFRGYLRGRWVLPMLALGTVTIIASDSRTAMLALAGAAALVGLRSRRRLLPGLAGLAMVCLLVFSTVDTTMFSRSGSTGEIMTLTGRTELWSFVLEKIGNHPLLGHGLNSFEATVVDEWYGNPDAGVATHNNYLEVLYSCGIVGFIAFMLALALLVRRWFREPDVLRDLFVLDLLITGFTEVEVALAVVPVFMLFMLIAMDAKRRMQPLASPQVRHA